MFACPECRKRLSESAASCPKCGAVVNTEVVKKAKDAEKRGFMVFITIAAIVVVPLVGLAPSHWLPLNERYLVAHFLISLPTASAVYRSTS